jgi:uncharacterized membrane protein
MGSYGMLVHIAGGTIALLAGSAALGAHKGGLLHQRGGMIFFISMMVMAGSGAALAALKLERGTALIGIFTFYLVLTSWGAAKRKTGVHGHSNGQPSVPRSAAQLSYRFFAWLRT